MIIKYGKNNKSYNNFMDSINSCLNILFIR